MSLRVAVYHLLHVLSRPPQAPSPTLARGFIGIVFPRSRQPEAKALHQRTERCDTSRHDPETWLENRPDGDEAES